MRKTKNFNGLEIEVINKNINKQTPQQVFWRKLNQRLNDEFSDVILFLPQPTTDDLLKEIYNKNKPKKR
jgi:hypothetical protein